MTEKIANRQSQIENLSCLSNSFSIQADWLRIPYGDHPHPQNAVQRLTRQTAEALSNNFHGIAARLGRFFGGKPIFVGHPDDPRLANEYPDKKSYGWIMDMEAREDGLYLKPKWSRDGEELIANAHYKWFSPFWGCSDLVRENGKRIVTPMRLISLGLTNSPVINGMMPLANEASGIAAAATTEQTTQNPPEAEKGTMKNKLITLLGLANEATEEQILATATALKTGAATAESALANEKTASAGKDSEISNLKSEIAVSTTNLANERTERTAKETALQTEIANERKARIVLVLDNAIAVGKITAAQRPQWAADLEKDLDGKLVELSNAKSVMNTESKTKGLGTRNANAVADRDASIRRDKVLNLVNEKMQKTGEDYETAFANIRKEQPALFADMKQPQKK